jgi:heptosyltransferase-2
MKRILIIQTAFTGDVVLATALIEKLKQFYPNTPIDFLLRKGNESLLQAHPHINKLWIWDKKKNKISNLLKLGFGIRKTGYSHIINVHRFASSGMVCLLSGAKNIIGFNKNPLSFCFTLKMEHVISAADSKTWVHETERNQLLISSLTDTKPALPKLYPSTQDYEKIAPYQSEPYICISPASVWFTKQYPANQWIKLIKHFPLNVKIYLLGGPGDVHLTQLIKTFNKDNNVEDLCGKLSFLQSAALIKGAIINYTNDSAPLHFATAMNAPVKAIFCSTVPAFGFGPLRQNGQTVEVLEQLPCRPCGLHGRKNCPEGHFKCAMNISLDQLYAGL